MHNNKNLNKTRNPKINQWNCFVIKSHVTVEACHIFSFVLLLHYLVRVWSEGGIQTSVSSWISWYSASVRCIFCAPTSKRMLKNWTVSCLRLRIVLFRRSVVKFSAVSFKKRSGFSLFLVWAAKHCSGNFNLRPIPQRKSLIPQWMAAEIQQILSTGKE